MTRDIQHFSVYNFLILHLRSLSDPGPKSELTTVLVIFDNKPYVSKSTNRFETSTSLLSKVNVLVKVIRAIPERKWLQPQLSQLVWHLGLLLQQGHVSQVLLVHQISIKAISTKGILEFREGGVKVAGQRVEDDLTWRYASHNGHQYIHIFG